MKPYLLITGPLRGPIHHVRSDIGEQQEMGTLFRALPLPHWVRSASRNQRNIRPVDFESGTFGRGSYDCDKT